MSPETELWVFWVAALLSSSIFFVLVLNDEKSSVHVRKALLVFFGIATTYAVIRIVTMSYDLLLQ